MGLDYTSLDVGLKQRSSNTDCSKKCILQVDKENFKISKHLSSDTVHNPLEMFESLSIDTNRNILKASGLSDGFEIKGFETELDLNSINSLYAYVLLRNYTFSNLVVAVRDYYTEEEIKTIGQIFSVRKDTKVTIIPASLAFVINYKMATVNTEDYSLIVSTRGNKAAFNVYKSTKGKEKFTIENILNEVYDEVSDNKIQNLILKNVKRQIIKHVENSEVPDKDFTIYPILDKDSTIYDKSLDLLEVYDDIRNSVLSNHVSYTIREIFVNDPVKKFPLLDIAIDIQDIIKEINEFLEVNKEKFENIVQNIKNTMVETGVVLNSVYFITDFFPFFERFFDLDGANKVQNSFIKSGCSTYDKSKLELKNIKMFETFVYVENDYKKLLSEIEYKNEAKEILKTIEKKGGLSNILSNLKEEVYGELEKAITNLNEINLNTSKRIVNDYKSLIRKDLKIGKGRKEREENKKVFEKALKDAMSVEKSEPEVWESGLDKRIEPIKKWFEEARDDENVLGFEFETKANLLEGYVQAFRNKLVRKKQEEEKKKQEEEKNKQEEEKKQEEKNKQEEEKKQGGEETQLPENDQNENTPESETDKPIREEFTEKEIEDAKKLLEDNQQIPDMNNFDYEAFQKKFDELMKNDKYKKLMDESKGKGEGGSKEENPNLESREL